MKEIQKLREERNGIVSAMRALHETAEKETRGLSADEEAQWVAMGNDLDQLDGRIQRAEKLDAVGHVIPSELRAAQHFTGAQAPAPSRGDLEESNVFDKFLRIGLSDLSAEERGLMMGRRDDSKEARTFSIGSGGNVGGFTVSETFRNQLEVALKAYGGMLEVADILRTDTGASLSMPTFNFTQVAATIVGENAPSLVNHSTPFDAVTLGAFTYRSPILPVSYEFLQDSAFGEGYLVEALSDSIGRAMNAHFTHGTGTGQPRGILRDAVLGATGSAEKITADDLFDLEHSIDPAYRRSGCRFMMHDLSFKAVRKLKDSQGRPIFLPGYDGLGGSGGDSILGYGVSINQDMPTLAAGARSVLFGRFDKYKIRWVKNISILRLTERYAENLQVAFLLYARADGRLLDAGTHPVKYFQNGAAPVSAASPASATVTTKVAA